MPPQTPLSILVALDVSRGMKPFFAEIQKRLVGFVKSTDPKDKIAILTFSDKNMNFSGFSTDPVQAFNAVNNSSLEGYCNLDQAISYIYEKCLVTPPERTAILIISDAFNPYKSLGYKSKNLKFIKEKFFPVYSVCPKYRIEMNLPNDLPSRISSVLQQDIQKTVYEGQTHLRELAENSGGIMIDFSDVSNVEAALNRISSEIRNQYTVGYYPQNTKNDGKFRRIEVKIKGHDYLARSRRGYLRSKASSKH